MPTLTETAHYTRKILKYGTLCLVAFFILRFSLKTIKDVHQKLRPPPPPPPTVSFGKLPQLTFPSETLGKKDLTYKLETIQGGLPQLPNIGKVYFMPRARPNLLALDRANQQARKMGFTSPPQALDETHYRWTTQPSPSTILEMDINTGNFHLKYEYENDPEVLTGKNLPNNEQAALETKNFLTNQSLLTDDLAQGSAEFDYLRFAPPELISVSSLSEADFIRVNLFRVPLDDLKIMPPNPRKSSISFLFSGSRTPGKRIIEINYVYFPIERETFATYPLKSVTQAWNELQAGQASVASLGQNENEITLRQVYLAYYDTPSPQHFLQPIYVFEGDRSFFAYVPALEPKWLE